jgi:hypothetical protein
VAGGAGGVDVSLRVIRERQGRGVLSQALLVQAIKVAGAAQRARRLGPRLLVVNVVRRDRASWWPARPVAGRRWPAVVVSVDYRRRPVSPQRLGDRHEQRFWARSALRLSGDRRATYAGG